MNLHIFTNILTIHRFSRLLQDNRCLLAIQNAQKEIHIFLEKAESITGAIEIGHSKKMFHRDKIGSDFLFAYDEIKRMLAVCAVDKVSLYFFCRSLVLLVR